MNKDKVTKVTKKLITKNMKIEEIVIQFPRAVEILMDEGIGCIGCGAAQFESIEEGLKGHGKSDEEVEEILKRMNEAVSE